jgi:hypothetical protein
MTRSCQRRNTTLHLYGMQEAFVEPQSKLHPQSYLEHPYHVGVWVTRRIDRDLIPREDLEAASKAFI